MKMLGSFLELSTSENSQMCLTSHVNHNILELCSSNPHVQRSEFGRSTSQVIITRQQERQNNQFPKQANHTHLVPIVVQIANSFQNIVAIVEAGYRSFQMKVKILKKSKWTIAITEFQK